MSEVSSFIPRNVYTGLEDLRSVLEVAEEIEGMWCTQAGLDLLPESLRELNIDRRLTDLAKSSYNNGGRQLTVLDIGCGRFGVFVDSFLDKQNIHYYINF